MLRKYIPAGLLVIFLLSLYAQAQSAPTITGMSSSALVNPFGQPVTIQGTSFGASQGTVTFGGVPAAPNSWIDTKIVVPVPAGVAPGVVDVVVTTVNGASSNAKTIKVMPVITACSPTTGVIGTPVTLTGAGFGDTPGTSTVTFKGIPATLSSSSWSNTTITIPVPVGASNGNIVVTINGVAANGVPFYVSPNILSLQPPIGPVGTPVTINGNGFGQSQNVVSGVTFNGVSATIGTWSDTVITTTVPAGASTGNVVVTNASNLVSSGVSFTVGQPLAIVASRDIASNGAGWNNTPVTVSFACSGGVAPVNCPSSQVVTAEGANQIISGTATDSAGSSATASVTVSLDKTPPTITAQVTPAPNANGWNNTPVTVSYTCSDALSGVAACPGPTPVSTEGANQSISNMATDKAGNDASTSVSLNIDMTPPVVSIISPVNGTTVTTGRLSVRGTVSDALSGVASVSCNGTAATVTSTGFTCPVSLVSGQNQISVLATDLAGNTTPANEMLTYNPVPVTPPTGIQITPNLINLVTGAIRPIKLVDSNGNFVQGATWKTSDATILQISSDDPPQLSAIASGPATLTATFNPPGATTPLTSQAQINVYPGASLPNGVPAWAIGTMSGNTGGQGFFASQVHDTDPAIYVEEDTATGGVIRALSGDGQQLWATAVPSGGSSTSAPQTQAFMSAAGTTGDTSSQNSLDSQIQHWQTVKAENPGKAAIADFHLRELEQAKTNLGASEKAIGSFNRPSFNPSSALFNQPSGLQSAASLSSASAASSSGSGSILVTLADTQGGTLSLIQGAQGMSLVRVDATGLETGRYNSPNTLALGAVHPDGTVFLFEKKSTTPFVSVIGVDSITGMQKFTVPLEVSTHTSTGDCDFPVPSHDEFGAVPGPMAIAADGRAYFTYTNVITDQVVAFSTCNQSGTTDNFLRVISIDSSGAASRQLLHEYKGVNTLTYGAPGSGIASTSHNDLIPVPVAADTIADGNDGVLAAWSYVVPGGFQDCTDYGGGNSVCSPLVPDAAQAKISHVSPTAGITEYVAPLQNWLAESTYSVFLLNNGGNQLNPGTLMLLGGNGVAYGTNGDKLAAFDSSNGSALWAVNKQTVQDSVTLYATTTDQNNHAGVMGMDSATSQQQMQLFDGSTITPSPLGLLNPDYDPTTQSWFGFSPALGAQAVIAQSTTPQLTPDFSQWQSVTAHKKGRSAEPPVITTVTPDRGLVGTTVSVDIKGTNFNPNSQIDVDKSLITVQNRTFISNKEIAADFIISPNAKGGNVPIKMTSSGPSNGLESKSKNFFVQIPQTLKVISSIVLPTGAVGGACTIGNNVGIQIAVIYQVQDQAHPPQSIMSDKMEPQEKLLNLVVNGVSKGDPVSVWTDVGPTKIAATSKFTYPVGTFYDAPYGACAPQAFSLSFTQPLSVLINGQYRYTVRTNNTSVAGQSDGHGVITNQSDIDGTR